MMDSMIFPEVAALSAVRNTSLAATGLTPMAEADGFAAILRADAFTARSGITPELVPAGPVRQQVPASALPIVTADRAIMTASAAPLVGIPASPAASVTGKAEAPNPAGRTLTHATLRSPANPVPPDFSNNAPQDVPRQVTPKLAQPDPAAGPQISDSDIAPQKTDAPVKATPERPDAEQTAEQVESGAVDIGIDSQAGNQNPPSEALPTASVTQADADAVDAQMGPLSPPRDISGQMAPGGTMRDSASIPAIGETRAAAPPATPMQSGENTAAPSQITERARGQESTAPGAIETPQPFEGMSARQAPAAAEIAPSAASNGVAKIRAPFADASPARGGTANTTPLPQFAASPDTAQKAAPQPIRDRTAEKPPAPGNATKMPKAATRAPLAVAAVATATPGQGAASRTTTIENAPTEPLRQDLPGAPDAAQAVASPPSEARNATAPAQPARGHEDATPATRTTPFAAFISEPAGPATTELHREAGLVAVAHSPGVAQPQPPVPGPPMAVHVTQQLAAALADQPDRPVEIALSPEELGRVRMTLHHGEAGLTVAIHAERPETLDLMRRNIDMLVRDFRDLGYSEMSFSFSGQSGQDRPESRPGQPDSLAPAPAVGAPAPRIPILAPLRLELGNGGLDLRI